MEPVISSENLDEVMISLWNDKDALSERGLEATLNHKGCSFHVFGTPGEHWISSSPDSDLPLLDAGACFGFQTINALKSGRDVIALDMCEEHISALNENVGKLDQPGLGRLVRTIVTQLPNPDVIADESVSGILSSQVFHFYKPEWLSTQLDHFFRWLVPGGKLVVTAGSWPARIEDFVLNKGAKLAHSRSPKDVLEMMETATPRELVDATPGLIFTSDGRWKDAFGEFLYLLSTVELRELAESSGFSVEEVRYCHSGVEKWKTEVNDTVLLVARKPTVRKHENLQI